jgi:ABC-2 type transport system permease protein
VSISKTNPLAFGDLIYGITLAIISVGTDSKKIILFVVFAFMGGIILTAFSALVGSFVFWLKRGEQFAHSLIFAVIVSGTYPEGVFKGITKLLFYTVIPIGFVVYTPLKIILSFNIVSFFCLFLITVLFVFLAFYTFKKGLKRYSSSNLMNARV